MTDKQEWRMVPVDQAREAVDPVANVGMGSLISTRDRLPEKYRDVMIWRRIDGDEEKRVARRNHYGQWEIASYGVNKIQTIATDVLSWFDEAAPQPAAPEDNRNPEAKP